VITKRRTANGPWVDGSRQKDTDGQEMCEGRKAGVGREKHKERRRGEERDGGGKNVRRKRP